MDRLLNLTMAASGALLGLLIATDRMADGVAPLLLVLAASGALRMRQRDPSA